MKSPHISTDAALDTITCLVCLKGYSATKKFVSDGTGNIVKHDFNAGSLLNHFDFPINDIFELSEALFALETNPNAFVIRGQLYDYALTEAALRRTGSGEGQEFTGNFMTPVQGRYWVLIDVDKLMLPMGLELTEENLEKILDWITQQFPPELQGVSFHWQLSSSAGVFNNHSVSAHFWFWLTDPVTNADLKAWGAAFNATSKQLKIDLALFQHVQAHYTAAPIFEGMEDPFPKRSGLTRKERDAATIAGPTAPRAAINKPPTPGKAPITSKGPAISKGPSGFEAILASIGDHPGGGGFRLPLLRAAASYVSTHGAANTDPQALYERLRRAVLEADASAHTPEEIANRASYETIMPMITSAIKKYGDQGRVNSPHLVKGVGPYPAPSETHLAAAQVAVKVQAFFAT